MLGQLIQLTDQGSLRSLPEPMLLSAILWVSQRDAGPAHTSLLKPKIACAAIPDLAKPHQAIIIGPSHMVCLCIAVDTMTFFTAQ